MRILMVAYACEPGRGSESEVGWRWASLAAEAGHDVTVLTRANNRLKIEKALKARPEARLHFEYREAPLWALRLKSVFVLPRLYYALWQLAILGEVWRSVRSREYDRYHHITYVSARFPSVLAVSGRRFVWGPIGGLGSVPRALRSSLTARGRAVELLRSAAAHVDRVNPLWLWTTSSCARVLVADCDTQSRLPKALRQKSRLEPAIGIEMPESSENRSRPADPPLILLVGQLTARKGPALAIEALSQIKDLPWRCEVIGEGESRASLEAMTTQLGIHDRVFFLGGLAREEVLNRLSECSVFVSLSLRDSGGMALLEAAAYGCPLVYLALGAPGQIFGSQSIGAIEVDVPGTVSEQAARRIRDYLTDHAAWQRASETYREMAERLEWKRKLDSLDWLYGETTED